MILNIELALLIVASIALGVLNYYTASLRDNEDVDDCDEGISEFIWLTN